MARRNPEHGVNELLHRKRGEQFRHQQNVLRSRTHISSSLLRNTPTLPSFLADSTPQSVVEPQPTRSPSTSFTGAEADQSSSGSSKCSGPEPPKSWVARLTSIKADLYRSSSWRALALQPLYDDLGITSPSSRILPLSLLCLIPLIMSCTVAELKEDVLPWIPGHLRREVVRYCAVHHPLPSAKLFLMYEEDGHADGEMLIVGPHASIRDDYFIQPSRSNQKSDEMDGEVAQQGVEEVELDWEADESSPKLLQTFAAVFVKLSMSTVLSLPPTITHLSLIHLTHPIPIHRLPPACPLLQFLDLSFNGWLEHPSNEMMQSLGRVDWTRWSHLQTLGWRNCFMSESMLLRLNAGRWDTVNIIQ